MLEKTSYQNIYKLFEDLLRRPDKMRRENVLLFVRDAAPCLAKAAFN